MDELVIGIRELHLLVTPTRDGGEGGVAFAEVPHPLLDSLVRF